MPRAIWKVNIEKCTGRRKSINNGSNPVGVDLGNFWLSRSKNACMHACENELPWRKPTSDERERDTCQQEGLTMNRGKELRLVLMKNNCNKRIVRVLPIAPIETTPEYDGNRTMNTLVRFFYYYIYLYCQLIFSLAF